MYEPLKYELLKTEGRAKRSRFRTNKGIVETPVFMNVGTQAAIKGGLCASDLKALGCQIELSNTYHLHVRPGDETIKKLGGLHKFMAWNGPILTDSGGFQVFSLASSRKIKEEGVYFSSHVDGRKIFMGPEESIIIQSNLGSDIAMAFDECAPYPCERAYMENSVARTTRWLERCVKKLEELREKDGTINKNQALFGINQGGTYGGIRVEHAKILSDFDLAGYALGGLAVGESHEQMYDILERTIPFLPQNKPTYLMGVGTPENILEGVYRGVDFFDCVMPARNGRHGIVFTNAGKLNLFNAKYELDDAPITPDCGCPTCESHSRAYIRHLFKAREILALRLCVTHNLYFYNNLMSEIRAALDAGRFEDYMRGRLDSMSRNGA